MFKINHSPTISTKIAYSISNNSLNVGYFLKNRYSIAFL
uniref:Uncharacterized protein n=1 Tax=virus sp. ctdtS1 TaxID=2826808 RepID=A0A8S5NGL2_9VIRU|nr:MAG TPA: hypothetical protein [virus sp. ctdtS1]DAQ71814.1 MAG TPA: hypothetical protein [Bacteriophage sp.]